MRIFIGMTEIAGNYGQLAKGLRRIGHSVTFIGGKFHPSKYDTNTDKRPFIVDFYEKIMAILTTRPSINFFTKFALLFLSNVIKIPIFFWATAKHDVFIFGFGTSLLPKNIDLIALKKFNKRIICNISHGSDARPPYINGVYYKIFSNKRKLEHKSKTIKSRCDFLEKHADAIIGAPLSSQFLKKPFVDIFKIGKPYELIGFDQKTTNSDSKLRILHAPSNPKVKGTLKIKETISRLKDNGFIFEFIELSGQTNVSVLKELSLCDFVIDQLYSDIPMSRFVIEAAWFGKPAIVGGYGWNMLKTYIKCNSFLPIHACHPDNLENAIKKLIVDKTYRIELGKRAEEFIKHKWSPELVANRYVQLINNTAPLEWFTDPNNFSYCHGGGISESHSKKIIRDLIFERGLKSLQLTDKPHLERYFMKFSEITFDKAS